MLCDEKYFPTAGENTHNICIWEGSCCSSHVLFRSIYLVKAFDLIEFVYKDYLPAILNHTVTCITENGQDGFMWVLLADLLCAWCYCITIFNFWLHENYKLFRTESKTLSKLLKLALIVEDSWQVSILLFVSLFGILYQPPDVVEFWHPNINCSLNIRVDCILCICLFFVLWLGHLLV